MTRLPELPATPSSHFTLHVYGAVVELRTRLPQLEPVEFLAPYYAELEEAGFGEDADTARWWRDVFAWEGAVEGHLPLRALREAAALEPEALALLFLLGLPEEDARFGVLFEALAVAGSGRRPNLGLVAAWNPAFRSAARTLLRLGAAETVNPEAPRSEWALQVAAPLWDALRGEARPDAAPWARYVPPELLTPPDELVVPREIAAALAALPGLVADGVPSPLVVRGPRGSGRRATIGALARSVGRGLLQIVDPEAAGPLVGPLATALNAVPVIAVEPAPGETVEIPALEAYAGPVGIALGRRGGVTGAGVDGAVVLELPMPEAGARERLWRAALGGDSPDGLAEGLRTTGGAIRRLAAVARSQAALAGRAAVTRADVADAERVLHAQALDTLAVRVPVGGDWSDLVASEETMNELRLLESRCRHRERLADSAGTVGVRALLSGPSGTGKTLAARLLASMLGKDLYALEISTIVDKYLGETEKNLEAVFSRAEELDVVLLLDEGDALMTRRTDVRTSNDRYANLETNFLLSRLESFEGILVVTTNAGDRIDSAFRRRIDVVVNFKPPDPSERWAIWRLHLPAGHALGDRFLEEVAARCTLTGGQIRNAVLHAQLLALDTGEPLDDEHLDEAVRREYRKAGAVCPLRERIRA